MLEIGIVIAGFFLVLEVSWRIWKLVSTGKFCLLQERQPKRKVEAFCSHPYSLYCKRPDTRGMYPSNNLGYAGVRDYDIQRSEKSVRILVVGGSTVEDHAPDLGPNSSWPAVTEDILGRQFPDTRIEVINAGLAGYSSVESLVDFLLKGAELQPDILVIYHNINDVLTIQMADGFKPDYSHVRQAKSWELPWVHSLPQIRFLFSYMFLRSVLIDRAGMSNTILERISSPPWNSREPFDENRVRVFKRNIRHFAVAAHAGGCTPVVVKWECPWETEGLYPWQHLMKGDSEELGKKYFQYIRGNNEALKEVASELECCHYLDVGPFEKVLFRPDNLHFTGEGLHAMADRVARGLAPIVRARLDDPQA